MIDRKKKIISIQLVIFLFASFLLYDTYRDKNKKIEKVEEVTKIEIKTNPEVNSFDDIEYSGFDLNGNRYILTAGDAEFKTGKPEAIDMKNVVANFYLKDDTILEVFSDEGFYNNITLDMKFKKNVKVSYLTNVLLSDQLTYSNSSGKLLASGNVQGESVEKGEFFADNVEYDLTKKILNFSMSDKEQIKIKIKE